MVVLRRINQSNLQAISMKKVIIQGLSIVVLFFATLFVFNQIDWMTLFKVKENTKKTEEKLGDLYWKYFKNTSEENHNKFINKKINKIVDILCEENSIDRSEVKVHVLNENVINAFTLPDGHLVVNSGLILASDSQDELVGVISHELAHIELDHVMKKLVKEVGLSILISITAGNSGSDMIYETARTLSSSAFDREFEREADLMAIEYMLNAKVNPAALADFLYKLSDDDMEYLSWISTHPDSKERAEYIIEYSLDKVIESTSLLSDKDWKKLLVETDEEQNE